MRPISHGITLVELLVVLAIAGTVLGLGIARLDPGGPTTRQAAQVMAAKLNQARFEAVRTNNTVGIVFVADDGTESGLVRLCRGVDETVALTCPAANAYDVLRFSASDLGRARIASPATLEVYFDRRGIVRSSLGSPTITVTDRGGNHVRTVTVLPTGRAEVN